MFYFYQNLIYRNNRNTKVTRGYDENDHSFNFYSRTIYKIYTSSYLCYLLYHKLIFYKVKLCLYWEFLFGVEYYAFFHLITILRINRHIYGRNYVAVCKNLAEVNFMSTLLSDNVNYFYCACELRPAGKKSVQKEHRKVEIFGAIS